MLDSFVNSAGRIKSKNTFFCICLVLSQNNIEIRYVIYIQSFQFPIVSFFLLFHLSQTFFSIVYSRSHLTRLFAPFFSKQKCVWIEFSITFFGSTYKQNKGRQCYWTKCPLKIKFIILIELKTESTAASFSNNMCKRRIQNFLVWILKSFTTTWNKLQYPDMCRNQVKVQTTQTGKKWINQLNNRAQLISILSLAMKLAFFMRNIVFISFKSLKVANMFH